MKNCPMKKKLLLLGNTGKLGLALQQVFKNDYIVIGKHSSDFNASDFDQVRSMIEEISPDIVVNAVAFLGIDPSEKDPEKALRLNALYPKYLAELSNRAKYLLVHFSTDSVFNDAKHGYYIEKDTPRPLNMYGFTKYGGDCFIQAIAANYYIFRISVLFGEALKNNQFVERLLQKVTEGQKVLRISDDIILSPTYSKDIAVEVRRIIEKPYRTGLYHIANKGKASLFDLMNEIIKNLKLKVAVERASYKDFPYLGIKNTNTPIKSEKIKSLRPWKEAVAEYCSGLNLSLMKEK